MLAGQATGRSCKDNSRRTHVPGFENKVKHQRVASSCNWAAWLSAYGWFVVLGFLSCVLIHPAAAAQPTVKNVLVLHNWANLPQSWTFHRSRSRPGKLHAAITRLVEMGWIEPCEASGRQRPYWLTSEGGQHLETQLAKMRRLANLGLRRLRAI
jgi:hypothetical protein